jgi:drug/metabolite transporter (DMT)-like permease
MAMRDIENEGYMKEKHLTLFSDAALLLVAALWGGGFIAVKDGLNALTPMVLAALRFIIATIIFSIFFHRKIGSITRSEWLKGGIVGFFLFLGFAFQTVGLQYTTASKQGFLTATYVIMVPLIHWGISRKMPKKKVFLGSALTFVGIGLVSYQGALSLNAGDTLTLICAVFFALHIIAIDAFGKGMSSLKLSYLQMLVASVLFVIAALFMEPLPRELSWQAWRAVFYLGAFSTCLCFTLQTVAQRHTPPSHASMLLSLESIFAAIFGILMLDEVMTSHMIFGCALIFAAILIIELQFPKRKSRAR